MENDELQKIWRSADFSVNQKSKEELNLLLESKAKQTINRFLIIIIISVIVSAGLLAWLIITSINRKDDMIFLINNATIGIITVFALFSGVGSWYELQNNKYNQPLRLWLEERIKFMSKNTARRSKNLHLFLLPILCVMITLSIHVYYEYKPFIEVLKTDESVAGLIVGLPVGLFVAFYAARKVRKYSISNLEFLKDLHNRLCNVY
jgi:hypothetical protein